MILSGEPFQPERKRRGPDQDRVMRVGRQPAEKAQEPSEPSDRELLLALTARIEQAEQRAEARHAELLDAVQELRGATHGWLQEVIDAVDELDDGSPYPV